MERQFSKNSIIQLLSASHHGDLKPYKVPFYMAAGQEPEFTAHLTAWNGIHGSIKDTMIALPLASLPAFITHEYKEGTENAEAHLLGLDPREYLRAMRFARDEKLPSIQKRLYRLTEKYIRHMESSYGLWERRVIQHRRPIKELYALPWTGGRIKVGSPVYARALFEAKYPTGSTLDIINKLPMMDPQEALGHALQRKIPFLVVLGQLGPKVKDPSVLLALIERATPTELITSSRMLAKYGVDKNPVLRAALREAMDKAATAAPKKALLKAGVQARHAGGDTEMGKTLQRVQEKQLRATGGVKGRWAIFGDKSASMQTAIEVTRFVAGHLARVAEEAHIVWFDNMPRYMDVTGKTLEEINQMAKLVSATGGTSPGVALDYLIAKGIEVDGIVIVSDGGERHHPAFTDVWRKYVQKFNNEPTLYVFEVKGEDPNWLSQRLNDAGITHELFNLRSGVDYYSLPNVIMTLNTRRYSLIDQIMETPLLTIEQVLTNRKEVQNAGRIATTA